MIWTPLCDLLGIKHPIIQGGMGPFSTVNLAKAVSKAGALGVVSHSGGPLMPGFGGKTTDQIMREALYEVAKEVDSPFGVNVRVATEQPDAPKLITTIIECTQEDSRIDRYLRAVITSAGNPLPHNSKIKSAGLLHFHVASSVYHAKKVESAGCDALIASGYEAGGHVAYEPVHTFVLIPAVVKAVKIPVIAAGGMCDGISLASALLMGAVGIQMGTRFIATQESDFLLGYKQAIISANETDTIVLPGFFGNCRYRKNAWTQQLQQMLQRGSSEGELLRHKVLGRAIAAEKGNGEQGSILCGMGAVMIKDIPRVSELINRIIAEAEELLREAPRKFIRS